MTKAVGYLPEDRTRVWSPREARPGLERGTVMGSNYQGLLGYALFLAGLAVGGLTVVALAVWNIPFFIAGAIIATLCLVAATALWLNVSRREHHDPLEPGMTRAGARRYERRRSAGTC